MRELILRLLSSAIGYVGLVLMLRSPDPVRMFAIYLPSSILVTLALDRGRSELALRHGLSAARRRRIFIETCMLTAAGLLVAVTLPFSSLPPRAHAIAVLGVAGALQAYIDIYQRDCLFRYRRSLYVLAFQTVLASLNAGIAALVAFGAVSAAWGLAAFAVLPSVASIVFLRVLGKCRQPVAREGGGERAGAEHALAALTYRAFPPAAYTAYTLLLASVSRDLAVVARALYFVFGFIHMRVMARESRRRTLLGTTALLFGLAAVTGVPLLVFSYPRPAFEWGGAAGCAAATLLASLAFSVFLTRYRYFIDGARDASPSSPTPAGTQ